MGGLFFLCGKGGGEGGHTWVCVIANLNKLGLKVEFVIKGGTLIGGILPFTGRTKLEHIFCTINQSAQRVRKRGRGYKRPPFPARPEYV